MLLLAQLARTLTVVNLMQPKSYCPLTRESTEQQTGTLDNRRGANMMRTTLIWGSLTLGVVPFLSHGVLYVQKYYLTTLAQTFRNKTWQFEKQATGVF